ncbi:sensor histidine kinase [Thiolapillus brandeum]|uniref:sensor histidine kinase n=1 Tax=Thiolapillus brandeum TaxID=1076588 RepID=UPI00155B0D56|nr:ATP-binding protein [Thiolapillus brandeum]
MNHKFTVATIAGFLMSSVVFMLLFLTFYQEELKQERAQAVREVNNLLQSSLENAMLKRDLAGLIYIVRHLGKQPNISSVMIVNPKGEVRFASRVEDEGRKLPIAMVTGEKAHTLFTRDVHGREVLRSVNPVHNKAPCQQCHGPMREHPVNGILLVDYDATSIRQQARNTTLMLMGAGSLIVIVNLVGGWWFIRRFILKPVASLSRTSQALSRGELDARVDAAGNDELARLGQTFNQMADNLQRHTRKLDESKAFLQAMIDAIPDGVRIIDADYNMLLVNRTFLEQAGCGADARVGGKCYAASHGLDSPCPSELYACPVEEIQRTGEPMKVIHHHVCEGGDSLDVEVYAAPMTIPREDGEETLVVESIRDLSKEVRFTHEQRLSELGRLAAGVAHEIYNPLSSMKLALHSLMLNMQRDSSHASDVADDLAIVEEEMDQCIHITDKLLRLSATPLEKEELVDIQEVLTDTLSLLRWDAEQAGISIHKHYSGKHVRVISSSSEIRMLMLNLVQNAFHAMPEGGELQVHVECLDGQVLVRISDTGVGIAEDELPYIFMPFFSRRADGVHGTGLGLSISKTIVKAYGGTLSVTSRVGQGSSFLVSLPEATEDSAWH